MVTMISRANKLVEIESMFVVYLLLRGWIFAPRGVQSC